MSTLWMDFAFEKLVSQGRANAGDAAEQVDHFSQVVSALTAAHPEAAGYEPGSIL